MIIGQRVRPGCADDFVAWQTALNSESSRYPGFVAAELNRPTAVQPDWGVIYRFDTLANLEVWLNSATRQDRLAEGAKYLAAPSTQQVILGSAKPLDELVTVAVSHRVDPDDVEQFLRWQERLRLAESKFAGFRGSELFRPVDGVQDEWTALYRYDTAADLDRWLTSSERQRLLAEGARFSDFQLRTIDNSFGSWFAFDDHTTQTPSRAKTVLAVWFGLYPTVTLLTLLLSPLRLPLWLGLLVGNLLSSTTMTFVVMPYYANRLLKHWLRPPVTVPARVSNLRGLLLIAAVMPLWALTFYLITRVFWHLP